MIDAVSTLSVQSGALRGNPQNAVSLVTTGAGVDRSYANLPKLGTRLYVRIDSAAERAILEVRASETGEVVNQYPSEAQIKAFQRAEKLAAVRDEQAAREMRDVQVSQRDIQTPEPAQPQQASSVIAPSSAPSATAGTSVDASFAPGSGGAQSIIA